MKNLHTLYVRSARIRVGFDCYTTRKSHWVWTCQTLWQLWFKKTTMTVFDGLPVSWNQMWRIFWGKFETLLDKNFVKSFSIIEHSVEKYHFPVKSTFLLRKFTRTHFWQKFRESNVFTKEITKSWFDEIFFHFSTQQTGFLAKISWNHFLLSSTVWKSIVFPWNQRFY